MKKFITITAAIAALAVSACTSDQLAKITPTINKAGAVGNTIVASAPTIVSTLEATGALSPAKAAETQKGVAILQQLVADWKGNDITNPYDIATGVQLVDKAVAQYVQPGTATAKDLAVVDNLAKLVQQFVPPKK